VWFAVCPFSKPLLVHCKHWQSRHRC
jgi:hypothetical protein